MRLHIIAMRRAQAHPFRQRIEAAHHRRAARSSVAMVRVKTILRIQIVAFTQ